MGAIQQALMMGAAALTGPCTWNPSDKNSEITLSNGNLNASHPSGSGFKSVRGTISRSSGLKYFTVEATVISPGSDGAIMIGIADANYALTGGYIGQNSSSIYKKSAGLWCKSILYHNMTGASGTIASTSYAAGAIVGVLVDFSAFNIKFYNDTSGVLLGQFTDTGPWSIPMFPAVSIFPGGSVSNLNCAGSFSNLPVGADAWDD